MKMTFSLTALKTGVLLVCLAILGGCAAPKGYDYTAFLESKPASILVLPPVNQSPDVKASYSLYSQVTLPLSEAGYYVMPVGVVDETFKQNGLMNAEEVRQASPQKLREIFGADSVLYLDVTEYGSSYKIISSEVAVTASAKLVDVYKRQPIALPFPRPPIRAALKTCCFVRWAWSVRLTACLLYTSPTGQPQHPGNAGATCA